MANKRAASPELSPIDGFLKRGKSQDDIETIRLVPKVQAWDFDVAALMDSPTHVWNSADDDNVANNFKNYDPSASLFILCVTGRLDVQYQMLCPLIPELLKVSPTLQTLILTWSFAHSASILTALQLSLPVVEATGTPSRHFLQLGLLHPLGGGKQPLDAIVVLDTDGKRRLVLPFGWGAGRHVSDPAAGVVIKERYSQILLDSIKALEAEKQRTDFYDVARTYF